MPDAVVQNAINGFGVPSFGPAPVSALSQSGATAASVSAMVFAALMALVAAAVRI